MTREQIGRALEYSNPKSSIEVIHRRNKVRLNKFSTTVKMTATNEKQYNTTLYNVRGIYEICRKSHQPNADKFYDWVYDILEDIRKYGIYATDKTIDNIIANPDFGIKLLSQLKQERLEKSRLANQIQQDKPYTDFGKLIETVDDSIPIGAFAKLLQNNYNIDIGRNKLFEWLRDQDYLIKRGDSKNTPRQLYINQGLFQIKETVIKKYSNDIIQLTTLVTGKGQLYFAKKIRNEFDERKKSCCTALRS